MNNKIVNLALLAENVGKLDKAKLNINNLFNEIKKILEYLNAEDEGDFKEKRQEFIDKLTPIVNKIDDILLKYIEFLKSLISSEQEFEGSQASELAASTEEMKRRSGGSGGSSGGGSGSGGGSNGGGSAPITSGGTTPSNTSNQGTGSDQTSGTTSGTTSGNQESAFKQNNNASEGRNPLIEDILNRLRGNNSNTSNQNGTNSGNNNGGGSTGYTPSTTSTGNNNGGGSTGYTPSTTGTGDSGAGTSPSGSGSLPTSDTNKDNLGKLSTGGEEASNKLLDDLLKTNVSPDEQVLPEGETTLEENLPLLTEGENNPVTDNLPTEDSSLTDLSTSTIDDSLPADNGSNSDWIKYAGLGTLGLGAVGLGTAALMSKNKNNEDELASEETEETTNSDWSTVDTTGYNDGSFNTTSSSW